MSWWRAGLLCMVLFLGFSCTKIEPQNEYLIFKVDEKGQRLSRYRIDNIERIWKNGDTVYWKYINRFEEYKHTENGVDYERIK